MVYAEQRNGDLALTLPGGVPEAIAFDADGVEALLRVNVLGFSIYRGLNDYRPDSDDPLLDPGFRKRYGIAGVQIGIVPNMYARAEARVFDDSVGPRSDKGYNVLAIGVHYSFRFKELHRR